MNYIESYIYLLKIRFGESLDIKMGLSSEDKQRFIVPLSLQILFENAIKHNVVSRKRPLHIMLHSDEKGRLVFTNTLQLKDQKQASTGMGLENINKRFKLVSDLTIHVEETNDQYIVTLPLLNIDNYDRSDR